MSHNGEEKYRRAGISLTSEIMDAVDKLSDRHGINRSNLIEMILRRALREKIEIGPVLEGTDED